MIKGDESPIYHVLRKIECILIKGQSASLKTVSKRVPFGGKYCTNYEHYCDPRRGKLGGEEN